MCDNVVCENNREIFSHVSYRKKNYDDSFLNEMNPFSAYFIGLFVTDGCFTSKDRSICINSVDTQLIYDLAKLTNYKEDKIRIRKRKATIDFIKGIDSSLNTLYENMQNYKPLYTLEYFGNVPKKIYESGYFPGPKTGKEFIPSCITDELFPYFLLGVWDGDGSWHIVEEYGWLCAGLCCTNKQFLIDIKERLERLNIVKGGGLCTQNRENFKTLYNLVFRHADSIALGDYLYKQNISPIKLGRKYEVYLRGSEKELHFKSQKGLVCTECGKPAKTMNLCATHYYQKFRTEWRHEYYLKHKKPPTQRFSQKGKTCLECDKPAKRKNLCFKHYNQKYRSGKNKEYYLKNKEEILEKNRLRKQQKREEKLKNKEQQ